MYLKYVILEFTLSFDQEIKINLHLHLLEKHCHDIIRKKGHAQLRMLHHNDVIDTSLVTSQSRPNVTYQSRKKGGLQET